jgi:hypothetical protein
MKSAAPAFSIVDIALFERPVRLRLPFRFGAATVTAAPQAFVRARVRLADGREAAGATAELMVPKWFDKDPALSHDANFDQLRRALIMARDAYLADATPRTAFGHFAAHHDECAAAGARAALNPLTSGFGPAEIDRALVDALCRALGVSFFDAMRANAAGFAPGDVAADLAGFDGGRWLASLQPSPSIFARHTVGLADAIAGHPRNVGDGLPESLEDAITAYGHRHFKLKIGRNVDESIERLAEIAAVLDSLTDYRVTLDGNEQFDDTTGVAELLARIAGDARLARLARSADFLEQPIARNLALERDVAPLSRALPLVIDESDASLDAFPRARALGYAGVSSKSCKGLYKSLVNGARCRKWNDAAGYARHFLTGEDLTVQPGLALQQDLALVALLGLAHVERNGHHYVNGMAGVPVAEQHAFHAMHPDLYTQTHGAVRLAIRGGEIALRTLGCNGFASGADPLWSSLETMREPGIRADARSAPPILQS